MKSKVMFSQINYIMRKNGRKLPICDFGIVRWETYVNMIWEFLKLKSSNLELNVIREPKMTKKYCEYK